MTPTTFLVRCKNSDIMVANWTDNNFVILLISDSESWRARYSHEKHDGNRQRILRNARGGPSIPLFRGHKSAGSSLYKL